MILTTLLAAAALLNGTQQQALTRTAPAAVATNTSEATAEGTEILRRILVESLDDALTDRDDHVAARKELREHLGPVTRLWSDSRTVQHSRAFHVPEAGLFLALDVSLPVVSRDAAAKDDKDGKNEKPTDDEWERMQREVRGQSTTDGFVFRKLRLQTPVDAEIDPKAIENVIDVVLKTLARHATRVEGLGSRDTVTVALRLGGRSHNFLQNFEGGPGALSLGENGDEKGDDDSRTFSAYVIASSQDVREQNLTVRIALSDLAGMADAGADKLRQRAQVNLY